MLKKLRCARPEDNFMGFTHWLYEAGLSTYADIKKAIIKTGEVKSGDMITVRYKANNGTPRITQWCLTEDSDGNRVFTGVG